MTKKVVVENNLEEVRVYLGEKGYDVRTMYRNDTLQDITSDNYEAIIVSDLNNMNLSQGLKAKASIVEAAGLTPEQIYQIIHNKVRF
ncbi:YkuS family protein [Anaerosolibacter sp.]|uniref:YkuS family protein n=1 Tax=Anaerosolibacter sp. TaxID=1872527 RepID=UPI0039F01260